jgi:hypothetical protein
MDALPPTFVTTREAIRALACYVISPARKARTGHIALAPTADGAGIGTPPGDPGPWIGVRDDRLVVDPGPSAPVTTLQAAADLLGRTLDPDPGVGHDLPAFVPDSALSIDVAASRALAGWYAFGAEVHAELAARHGDRYSVASPQLWPEHFDLAVAIDCGGGRGVNVGFSGGDATSDAPYLYVGPWDRDVLANDPAFWNAPYGRTIGEHELRTGSTTAADFVDEALRRLGFL